MEDIRLVRLVQLWLAEGGEQRTRELVVSGRPRESPLVDAPCLSEFWAVVTGSRLSKPTPPAVAAAFIEALVEEGRLAVWQPGAGFHRRLMEAAVAQGVTGARVFDLQIALCSREHGALELWTHDAGFVGVGGLRVWDPLVG